MSVALERADDSSFDIFVDGKMVGYIEGDVDYILQIDVMGEYQGQGYGTAAVEVLIEKARQAGCEHVETSAVVSPAMESIVVKLGFEPRDDEPSHYVLAL